jgi:ribonuclease E
MLENEPNDTTPTTLTADHTADAPGAGGAVPDSSAPSTAAPRRRRAASRPAGPPVVAPASEPVMTAPAPSHGSSQHQAGDETSGQASDDAQGRQEPAAPARRRSRKAVTPAAQVVADDAVAPDAAAEQTVDAHAGVSEPADAVPANSVPANSVPANSVPTNSVPTNSVPADSGEARVPRRRGRKAAVPLFSAPVEPVRAAGSDDAPAIAAALLFMAPEIGPVTALVDEEIKDDQSASGAAGAAPQQARRPLGSGGQPVDPDEVSEDGKDADHSQDAEIADDSDDAEDAEGAVDADGVGRRRRRRGGRGRRRRPADGESDGAAQQATDPDAAQASAPTVDSGAVDGPEGQVEHERDGSDDDEGEGVGTRRRRRRRRRGGSGESDSGEPADGTVVHVREPREPREPRSRSSRGSGDEVTAVRGSTRLEAKKQRRREGRDAGRRRPPILSEAEFLSRRESVNRVMVIRQRGDLTQIAVLEDSVLVEHYVASASSSTMQGNVYLGKVQNVLPSMEAAFIDIGRGRNAVLYAGEVNWDAAGLDGQPRRIEHVMKSGDSVLAQVTKDPMGQKGSRLTANVSLAGRFLVYVPDGSMSGISRKLPDTERGRLKAILKNVVPEDAGVIVRTAAEGATEEQLTHDVARLQAQWEDIQKKAKTASAPALLYGEPDLTVRVVRDLFNEDFDQLVVSGDDAWAVVQDYVNNVAPDLMDRVSRHVGTKDAFAEYRIDEQIAKGLDRKVFLPSGGSLVIDRTEAMTVVDVNTGKFVGKGSGNLEETVTRNNLEAAEEIVRQLRLRDIGGIIVVDFIDMVLESNRELVLRRLTECLGRDRTKHQVAEVTSLGLVQMTRKRIGQGLLEAFSEPCEVCNGRGIKVHLEPIITHNEHAHNEHGRGGHDEVDKAERVARVAKIAKASKLAKATPTTDADTGAGGGAGDVPEGVLEGDAVRVAVNGDAPAAGAASPSGRPGRSRQPRAPKAQAAPAAADSGAAVAVLEVGGAEVGGADVPASTEGSGKPPARRRRVAKKAQGSPDPAP